MMEEQIGLKMRKKAVKRGKRMGIEEEDGMYGFYGG